MKKTRAERLREIALKEKKDLQRVFTALKKIDHIKDKIDDSQDFIDIRFNEFLHIYGDTSLLYVNNGTYHGHFDDDIDALIKWLTDIAKGEIVFIEDRCWFSPKILLGLFIQPWNLKEITGMHFEKNKDKYLRRPYLRIYNGLGIIKRARHDITVEVVKTKIPNTDDAFETVWNDDRTVFCKIFFKNNTYRVTDAWLLKYDDYLEQPVWGIEPRGAVSIFDTVEKARELAKAIVAEITPYRPKQDS